MNTNDKTVLNNVEELITVLNDAQSIKDALTNIYMDYSRSSLLNQETPLFSADDVASNLMTLHMVIQSFDCRKITTG